MLHGRPSMMLGAGKPRLRLNDTHQFEGRPPLRKKPRVKGAFNRTIASERLALLTGPLPHLVCGACGIPAWMSSR